MSESSTHGICPACHREGRIGQMCRRSACARQDIHCIPDRFVVPRDADPHVGLVIGHNLLVERLHRSHIDIVYRALQLPALLEVELTWVPAEREPEIHDNLLRQAMALARVGPHPHVTRLVLFDDVSEGTFLCSDSTADCGTLAELILPDGNEPLGPEALQLMIDPLVSVLEELSNAHLVHGEIRPDTVFVRDGSSRVPNVVLGGFVRVPAVDPSQLFPTFDAVWRTPDQIEGRPLDATTDPYAVAALAFALAFGRPPFPADDRDAQMRAKFDPRFDPMEGLVAAVPGQAVRFFRSALARDATERLTSANFRSEWNRALEAMAAPARDADATPVAPPPRARERVERVERLEPRAAPEPKPPERPHKNLRWSINAPSIPDDFDEPPPSHDEPHAGTTTRLRTEELADLASQRGVPRMHKRGG